MSLTFNKRTAVVTGAGRGIGKAIAEALARQGVMVICVSKNEATCGAVAEGIRAAGGSAKALAVSPMIQRLAVAVAVGAVPVA